MSLETKSSTITLTEKAAVAVQEMFSERQLEGYALRVFVSGGGGCGCSGVQYGLALENNQYPNDTVTTQFGIDVIIDDVSAPYLMGATVDFIDDETGTGFKIENPNPVESSCGCGDNEEASSCGCGGSCS